MRSAPWSLARHLSAAMAALLLTVCVATDGPQPPDGGPSQADILDDRELLVLSAPPAQPVAARAEALGHATMAVHDLGPLGDALLVLRIPPGRTIAQAIAEIEAEAPGVTAGAHHLYRLQSAPPADGDRFYAHALIDWPPLGCRAARAVGMIDAGVPPDHRRLVEGAIVQRRSVGDARAPVTDHGTLMAELLIGPGRLRDATLYSAVVVDPARSDGEAEGVAAILRATAWLKEQGVDVVNISLAGPRNKLLDRGLGKAAAQGMVLVAAAGNAGPTAPPRYPAAFPFTLAVTAVDGDLAVYALAVQGDQIDIAAPGVDTLLERDGRLRLLSGTSAATPFVTAAIAAVGGARDAAVEATRRRLAARAVDLGADGSDAVFVVGLLQAPDGCRRR